VTGHSSNGVGRRGVAGNVRQECPPMISRLTSLARIALSVVVLAAVALAGQAGLRWIP